MIRVRKRSVRLAGWFAGGGQPSIFRLLLICCMLLCLCYKGSAAVVTRADSLKQELARPLPDSLKIKVLISLCIELAPREPSVALVYAEQAMTLSEQTSNNFAKARILVSIGSIYQMKSDFRAALTYYFRALRLSEAVQFHKIRSVALNNIGVCYSYLRKFDLASEYLNKSLAVKMAFGFNKELGAAYTNLADMANSRGKISEVIMYSQKAIEADRKYGVMSSTPFLNIGDAYHKLQQTGRAISYYKHALSIALEYEAVHNQVDCYFALGNLYQIEGDYKQAELYLFKARDLAVASGVSLSLANVYEAITEMYVRQHDYKNAFTYKEKLEEAKDKEFNETVNRQIGELQAKYDLDKKDNEIKLLNQHSQIVEAKARGQSMLSNLLIVAVVFILIISFVLWRNISFKQKVNKILNEKNEELSEKNGLLSEKNLQIELQKLDIEKANEKLNAFNRELKEENISAKYEALKSRTNPHFLFNSLSTLSSIVADDQQLAIEFIDKFSQLYRMILQTGDVALISVNEELEIAGNYLYLQQMRFGENMMVEINVPQEFKTYYLPPFALQIVVENAFKHNMVSSSRKLHVSVYVEDGMLTVSNNLQQRTSRFQSTGTGLKNITERYKVISDRQPAFVMTETMYIASLPLLKREEIAEALNEEKI